MTNSERNIAAFLATMPRGPVSERPSMPFLGVDECLNSKQICDFTKTLVGHDLIHCSSPLWYETRERDGVIVGNFLGGVDQDSRLRKSNLLIPNIGVPPKYGSWSDFRVVEMLAIQFTHYDNVILLSENTSWNKGGLRRLLNNIVGPALSKHSDDLSLTALFKKGKTKIEDYCQNVFAYVETRNYQRGYREFLF